MSILKILMRNFYATGGKGAAFSAEEIQSHALEKKCGSEADDLLMHVVRTRISGWIRTPGEQHLRDLKLCSMRFEVFRRRRSNGEKIAEL